MSGLQSLACQTAHLNAANGWRAIVGNYCCKRKRRYIARHLSWDDRQHCSIFFCGGGGELGLNPLESGNTYD